MIYNKSFALILIVFLLSCNKAKSGPQINFTLMGQTVLAEKVMPTTSIRLADLEFQAAWLYFGFLSCPDMCPTTLTKLKAAQRLLGHKRDKVATLFITIDPEADQLDHLSNRLQAYDLKGAVFRDDLELINALLTDLSVSLVQKENLHTHSTRVFLLDSKRTLVDSFAFQTTAQEIAKSTELYISAFQ